MGKRSKDVADQDDGSFSGDLRDGRQEVGPRTMERDSGGIQGFEYTGVMYPEDEES